MFGVNTAYIQTPVRRNAEPSALTERVVNYTAVLSDKVAFGINKIAFGVFFAPVFFNKFRIFSVRNKANVLTVVLFCVYKSVFFSNFADFGLCKCPKRKISMCKLFLCKSPKDICLVFARIV